MLIEMARITVTTIVLVTVTATVCAIVPATAE